MLGAIKGLINSEKAVAVGLLVVASTVLTALGHMTVAEWREYTTWLAGIYVGGKTVQGAVSAMASAKVEASKHEGPGALLGDEQMRSLLERLVTAAASPPQPDMERSVVERFGGPPSATGADPAAPAGGST